MKRASTALLAVMIVLSTSPMAYGYCYWHCNGDKVQWQDDPNMRASQVTFPPGDPYRTALGKVLDRWNNNPSKVDFNKIWDDNSVALHNGKNEVWGSDDQDVLDSAPAITYSWTTCAGNARIQETDVIFDVGLTWTAGDSKSSMTSYGGGGRSFRTTAMHEFGHAIGLCHSNNEYNIMGEDWDHIHANGSTATAYPGEDASDGAVSLYGLSTGVKEDVGVVHWRWTGTDGEYSTHGRTRMFKSNGDDISKSTVSGEPRYNVYPGQSVKVEFSYENNGTSDQPSVGVAWYVSTNSTISTGDTLLEQDTYSLSRNGVYTKQRTVQVPNNLTIGADYYIGAVVDPSDSIDEVYEANNATYIRIRIVDVP